MITPSTEFTEHSAEIERSLAKMAASVTPEDFKSLLGDPGRAMQRSIMDSVGADSTSIWLADIEENNLIVTHTAPDESLLGWSQPLNKGLTSLAFASEQSLCENAVYQNTQHSKGVDEALKQVTCALIATPFYFGGALQGVISCVQIKENAQAPDPDGFSAKDLNRVRRLSKALERLVNYRLLTTLLDLEL